MRSFLCVAALMIGLAGCVAVDPPASQGEKTASMKAYAMCLMGAAERLDDGRSDASSVAFGVQSVCTQELRQAEKTFGRGMGPDAQRMLEARFERGQTEQATAAVLRVRAHRRGEDN